MLHTYDPDPRSNVGKHLVFEQSRIAEFANKVVIGYGCGRRTPYCVCICEWPGAVASIPFANIALVNNRFNRSERSQRFYKQYDGCRYELMILAKEQSTQS